MAQTLDNSYPGFELTREFVYWVRNLLVTNSLDTKSPAIEQRKDKVKSNMYVKINRNLSRAESGPKRRANRPMPKRPRAEKGRNVWRPK